MRGCHFLDLPELGEVVLELRPRAGEEVEVMGFRTRASTSSTGPDCGGIAGVGLKRSGLASGRLGLRGGVSMGSRDGLVSFSVFHGAKNGLVDG